jgi:flagellar M-ring protein FliF
MTRFLRDLASQLKRLWNNSTPAVRSIYAISTAACVILLITVGWWSSRPQYIALAHNLAPDKASEIVDRLDAAGIPNQLNFSGSVVLVPKHQYNQATLQTRGLITTNETPSDDSSSTILPGAEAPSRMRELETTLAKAIGRHRAIASATVFLGQAEKSPFLIERKPSTASVMLTLKPGIPFGRADATSIARLVTNSIEGLTLEGVTITDTNGQTWHGGGTDWMADGQKEFQYREEQRLAEAALEHLRGMLGPGRAVVTVRADMDFTERTSEVTEYDPDAKVVSVEKTEVTEEKGGIPTAAGTAGVSSNTATASATAGRGAPVGSESTTEKIDKTYELSKKTDRIREYAGKLLKLSVAATVDIPAPAEGQTSVLDKTQVEELIKRAVGFEDQRDSITVVVGPLPGASQLPNEMVLLDRWDFYNNLARSASLGIASLVALFFGMKTIRKFREVVRPPVEDTTVSADRLRVLSEFTQRARENPEAMRAILSAWLNQPEAPPDEQQRSRAA